MHERVIMTFYPPNTNYASPQKYNPSIYMHGHRDVDWMLASPQGPRAFTRADSLESIGQFDFSHPFSQHSIHEDTSFSSKGSRRVKWNKNVKNGRNTVGCAAFQQRCSAFSSSFVDETDMGTPEKQRSLLQRFVDVAISNVQKCGVGIGRQCEDRGCVNASALSALIGGEMCTGCGADDEGNGFAQGRCPQCQSYFYDNRRNGNIGLRRQHRPMQVNPHSTQPPTHQHNSHYHANDSTSFQDAIMQHRDIVSHQPLMEPRLEMPHSSYNNEWVQGAIGLQNGTSFNDDENDRYAMNIDHQKYAREMRTRRRGRSGNRRTIKETTKLVGRCVVKSLSNPVQRLKHGVQRNGARRILTITTGR